MATNSQNPDSETQIIGDEPTRGYILKIGSHTWIDGKTYVAGDKMQLTKPQMERIGVERFEPVSVAASAGTGTADSIPNPNVERSVAEKSPAPAPTPGKTKG